MEHPMRRRAVSEGAGLRPRLMGLGIDFFPVHNSPEQLTPRTEEALFRSQTEAPRLSRKVKGLTRGLGLGGHSQSSSRATTTTSSKVSSQASNAFSMRSHQGMQGLLDAELGGSMVQLDLYSVGGGSGFKAGQQIGPNTVTPSMAPTATNRSAPRQRSVTISGATLSRNNTLFSHDASPSRNAAALKTLLGTSGRKASASAVVPPVPEPGLDVSSSFGLRKSASTTDLAGGLSLEKAKSKARVEVDIELESDTVVEGGYLRGKMQVVIRKATKRESPIWIGGGKMRIVGFEGLPNSSTPYTFYQVADMLSNITSASHDLFASAPDEEGFSRAREGTHILPFAMKIPVGGNVGTPKGVIQTRSGISIRYIAMGSIKLKDPNSPARSIAHFYRNVEIYPYLGPQILAPSEEPLNTNTSQGIFMGGPGKLRLAATLHRRIWVAGQRCYAHITINNETTKKVKTLTLTVTRTMTTFQPRLELDTASARSPGSADMDACETSTSKKEVATCTLDMGQKGEKGCVTAKGFWTGVQGGSVVELSHFIMLPPDALSISRGRLIEVDYRLTISASAGSLSSDISVSLPIRIINFLSIDPPPDFHVAAAQTTMQRPMYQLPGSRSTPNLNRRKSVSMENLQQHDEQLRPWELKHGEQPIRWRPPNHKAAVHSLQSMPSSQSGHPAPTAHRMDVNHLPQYRQQPQRGYSEPNSPARLAAQTSSPNRTSPTRSAMSQRGLPAGSHLSQSPDRGREVARDMLQSNTGTMTRSKTVAFADDYPQLTQEFPQRELAHRTAPPNQMSFNISASSSFAQNQPKSQKHARLMRAVSMAEQTPPVMKLTASTAADDEMSDSSLGGSDPDEAVYGKGEELISAAAHHQYNKVRRRKDHAVEGRDTADVDETVVVAPMTSIGSLLMGTAEDGDMSTDADWDDLDDTQLLADRSLDARDMARAVAGRLGEDANLMLAELPIDEARSRSASPLRSPPPMRRLQDPERMPRSQRSSPSRSMVQPAHPSPSASLDLQVRARSISPVKSSASYMGRLQSAMAFNSRTSSRPTTPLASPQAGRQPSSYLIAGLPLSSSARPVPNMPRSATNFGHHSSHAAALKPNVSRTASTPSTEFPFPHVGSSAEEDARWSGVPSTAKVTTMSRAAAVMTNIPSSGSSTGSASRSMNMHSDRGSTATTPSEHCPSRTSSSQSGSSSRGFPLKTSRPGHKSNLSTSSVSTESSLVTQSSTTSSSRGMPSSVKSKIAQLEARNKALKAFSTVGDVPMDEEVAAELPMRKSYSTITMVAEVQPHMMSGQHDEPAIDNRMSVSSSVSSAYSDIFQGSRPTSMKEGFNSPMFRRLPELRQMAR